MCAVRGRHVEEQFNNQLIELPDIVYDRIEASVDVLAANPGLTRASDDEVADWIASLEINEGR